MFITFLAVIFAGFGAAGIVMLLRTAMKDRVPKWATPVAAGLGMIAATIGSEMSWYSSTAEAMPEGFEVIATRERQQWFRPWTYVSPYIDSFVALDEAGIRENDAAPGMRLLNIYVFTRWQPALEIPAIVDCAEGRRADLIDGVEFDADGLPVNAEWIDVGADDTILAAACEGYEEAAS